MYSNKGINRIASYGVVIMTTLASFSAMGYFANKLKNESTFDSYDMESPDNMIDSYDSIVVDGYKYTNMT